MREAVGEGVLNDTEARELFEKIQNKAKARARARGMPMDAALAEVAGELSGTERTAAAIDKRNRLLSLLKAKEAESFVKSFERWDEGVEALFNGVARKGKTAAASGIHQKERFLVKSLTDRMVGMIEEGGAMEAWRKHLHEADVFRALHSLQNEMPDLMPDNREAQVIAKAIFDFQTQSTALMNKYGAWIEQQPGYGILQSYDRRKILREGRTGLFSPPDQMRARNEMRGFAESLNIDWERTYDGVDPDLFWQRVHDNLWTGVHEKGDGSEWDIDHYTSVHGAMAKKVSQSRVIWFADADSQLAWHRRYGAGDFVEVTERMLHRTARAVSLMQTLGPNWANTSELLVSNLRKQARDAGPDLPNSAAIVKGLGGARFKHYKRMLSGESSVSSAPFWSNVVQGFQDWTLLVKGGSIMLSSLADKGYMLHRMVNLGMNQLDAHAAVIQGSLPKGPEAMEVLRGMYAVHSSMTHNIASRYGFDARSSRPLAGAAQSVMNLQGFTHWNRANERTMAMTLAWYMGEHAGKPMDRLPPDLARNLNAYGLTPNEWDVVRRGAWSFQDGNRVSELRDLGIPAELIGEYNFAGSPRYLTTDTVDDLADAEIAALVESKGKKPTAGNLSREREELKWKLGTFVSDQSDIALNMPDLKVKYWMGKGIEAGTPIRIAADLVSIFKTFPVMATANMWRSVSEGEGWRGVWAHTLTNPSRMMQTAQLIAYATIAGYMANTIRDVLQGRTPKKLLDENGNPNLLVWQSALQRGGGAGIMGDFLFTEYDRQYRSISSGLLGPVLSQADPMFAAFTESRAALLAGDEQAAKDIRANLVTTAQANLPYASIWYVRPALNYFVMWNIREALSPGVMSRQVEQVNKQGYQTFWLDPARMAGIPMTKPGEKSAYLLDAVSR